MIWPQSLQLYPIAPTFTTSVTSCNNDVFNLSKGSGISIKVGTTADLSTRSSAVETIVLKSLDAGAPDLYVVATPYTPDEPSTRSAAVTYDAGKNWVQTL